MIQNVPVCSSSSHRPGNRNCSRILMNLGCLVVFLLASGVSRNAELSAEEKQPVLNAKRAEGYLLKICRLGTRISGTRGMGLQQKLLQEHFGKLGGKVFYQSFDVAHPLTGNPVRMANMIVSWHPDAKERVILCCHYDTRPYPDRDRRQPKGLFLGANDGASGVALMMELAHHIKVINPTYGVDMVFFDGEELVYTPRDKYFHGSEYFANQYKRKPPKYTYKYGVLVDMIGDRRLTLYQEKNSTKYAPKLTKHLWATAKKLGVREFIPKEKWLVRDDHLALNQIAKIPTCDIIDFDYTWWHTTQDLPVNCSGTSLIKVGKVLLAWLQNPDPTD